MSGAEGTDAPATGAQDYSPAVSTRKSLANPDFIVSMVDGVRAKDRTWNGASVRTAIAHHRNMLEASLAALNTVEAECLYHLAERETVIDFTRMPPARKPFGRRVSDSSLPAVVSTGSL